MTNTPKGKKAELLRILSFMTDTILEAPDEEILDEAEIEYGDPESAANEVRDTMLAAIKAFDQQKLVKAKLQYQESVREISEQNIEIPDSAEERQALLDSLIADLSGNDRAAMTAMFRDRKADSEKDFRSLLRQLQLLGKLKRRSQQDQE